MLKRTPVKVMNIRKFVFAAASLSVALHVAVRAADQAPPPPKLVLKPGLFHSLTEPPCSYCSTENRKGFVRPDERVLAWVRGAHNRGALPPRPFLSPPPPPHRP